MVENSDELIVHSAGRGFNRSNRNWFVVIYDYRVLSSYRAPQSRLTRKQLTVTFNRPFRIKTGVYLGPDEVVLNICISIISSLIIQKKNAKLHNGRKTLEPLNPYHDAYYSCHKERSSMRIVHGSKCSRLPQIEVCGTVPGMNCSVDSSTTYSEYLTDDPPRCFRFGKVCWEPSAYTRSTTPL